MMDQDRPTDGRGSGPLVAMRGITKRFGSLTAVAGANFDLYSGEIHALLGENGAGKTTLMNLLYGLERPDEGTIEIDGEPCTSDPRTMPSRPASAWCTNTSSSYRGCQWQRT